MKPKTDGGEWQLITSVVWSLDVLTLVPFYMLRVGHLVTQTQNFDFKNILYFFNANVTQNVIVRW